MRKGFCCNAWGKTFVENKELTRQLLTHKEVRHKTMKCDICDYSTDGITSLTHHKKIQYTHEKPFDCTKCGRGFRKNFIYINITRPPAKTKWKSFNALFVENFFRKSKILGSTMIIFIKALKGSVVNHVDKSLGKKCRLSLAFILKSNTLFLTCPFRNGFVRYARNHRPIQEP